MKIKVPGKVFIMGEYSVIDGKSDAIIAPTKRHLTLTLTPSSSYSFDASLETFHQADSWDLFIKNHPSEIFKDIVQTFKNESVDLIIPPMQWRIESDLDDSFHAYGLGSSGAFRVAIIRALLRLSHQIETNERVFNLAVKSHEKESASYGDLAVSTYEHAMVYHKSMNGNPPKIIPQSVPNHVIIHSGKKVKSTPFINAYLNQKKAPYIYDYATNIQRLIDSFASSDIQKQMILIEKAQTLYEKMAEDLHKDILDDSLIEIVTTIKAYGGIAKISGAGGGDNVLSFFNDSKKEETFIQHIKKDYIVL